MLLNDPICSSSRNTIRKSRQTCCVDLHFKTGPKILIKKYIDFESKFVIKSSQSLSVDICGNFLLTTKFSSCKRNTHVQILDSVWPNVPNWIDNQPWKKTKWKGLVFQMRTDASWNQKKKPVLLLMERKVYVKKKEKEMFLNKKKLMHNVIIGYNANIRLNFSNFSLFLWQEKLGSLQ